MNVTLSRPSPKSVSHISSHSVPPDRLHQDVPAFHNTVRFTTSGNDALEAALLAICGKVEQGIRNLIPKALLEGILLAGGYGRGEGGVLMTPGGERPYNDLEFYIFLHGSPLLNDRHYKAKIDALGAQLSESAGLDVEFKIESLAHLRSAPTSMFTYDLCTQHRWLIGDDSLLAGCEHHLDARAIPLHEATRLLFNRCTGMLFAAERLRRKTFTADDSDFVIRNLAKLQMALGDALLTAVGHYHWSCRERGHRMSELIADWEMATPEWVARIKPFMESLFKHHSNGIAFKLRPQRDQLAQHSREALLQRHGLLRWIAGEVWLALESRRLDERFANHKAYATTPINKCPEKPTWRNYLVNARTFQNTQQLISNGSRYPRERLFHALNLMLWNDAMKPDHLALIQSELNTGATEFSDLVAAYEALWLRFN